MGADRETGIPGTGSTLSGILGSPLAEVQCCVLCEEEEEEGGVG